MVGSTAIAQIIGFIFVPIIARLFTPEAIGLQNLFLSFVAILTPIGALALPSAIVLAKRKKDIEDISRACINISMIIFITLYLCIILIEFLSINIDIIDRLGGWVYLIPVYVFFLTQIDISKKNLIKEKDYLNLSRFNLINSVIVNLFKVISGFVASSPTSLLISINTSNIFSSSYSKVVSRGFFFKYKENSQGTYSILKKYYDFPLYRCPQMLVNAFSQDLPILLFASLYGVEVVGYYGMARLIMSAPVNLLGNSLNSILYPKFVDFNDNYGQIIRLLFRSIGGLAVISLIPFFTVFIFGGKIFEFILGNQWIGAGLIAEWISIMCFFSLLSRPIISVIPVIHYQKNFLIFEIFSTLIRASSLLFGCFYFSDYIDILSIFTLTSSLMYIMLTFIVMHRIYYLKLAREN